MEEGKLNSHRESNKNSAPSVHSTKSAKLTGEKTLRYPLHPISSSKLYNDYNQNPPMKPTEYKNPVTQVADINVSLNSLIYGLSRMTRAGSSYPISTGYTSSYMRNYSSVRKLPIRPVYPQKSQNHTFENRPQIRPNQHDNDQLTDYSGATERSQVNPRAKCRRKSKLPV